VASNSDSKQKRARQNRAQREAREARTKAAAIPSDERKAKYASATAEASAPAKGRGADRPRPERRPRPGDRPVDVEALEGNWFQKRIAVPGGSQVLMGTVLIVIVSVMSFIVELPKIEATKDRAARPAETMVERLGPIALVIILGTLALAIAASYFALAPRRRRIWLWAAVVCFAISLNIPWYMFPAGFFGYAVYRARKVEGPAPGSRAARMLAERDQAAERDPAEDDDDA
jgi:hypothetical protein